MERGLKSIVRVKSRPPRPRLHLGQVHGSDVTANEMAKTHARYLAGALPWRERRGAGRCGGGLRVRVTRVASGEMAGERLIRFEFPEHSGSLATRRCLAP